MLKQKSTPKNQTGWQYARRHLCALHDYEYLADTWPERLGTDDIAALQAVGKDYPVFQAWKVCLEKASEAGELVTQKQDWFLGNVEPSEFWTGKKPRKVLVPPCHANQGDDTLFFKGKAITRGTASPQDFADYLRKLGEHPSKYIEAWLDAFGIDPIEPEQQPEDVRSGIDRRVLDEPVVKEKRKGERRKHRERLEILERWYASLCNKLNNDRELIIKIIDGLIIEEIISELKTITPQDKKYLWAGGAARWIMDNGESVWKFERTKGGKHKKDKSKQLH